MLLNNDLKMPTMTNVWQLNLKKWFKYESQNVSDYDVSKPTTSDLDAEVEKNLNIKLPTWKLDETAEEEFIRWLWEDDIISFWNLINQWYSYNAAKALYENKDKYKDITAEWVSKYEKKPSNLPYYWLWAVWWLGTLELWWWWTQQLWRWLWGLWRWIYWVTISPSMNESRAKQRLLANQINAEDALKTAKSTWKWVEWAEKLYSEATTKLDDFRGVADTAYDYDVWWWVTKNWWPEARWADARAKANSIFTETIEPALKSSKSKINVQSLVNEIEWELEWLSKLDPDKASEYKDAFEELKKAFSDKKYSELSMSDSQTLKSWLQWRTPQKFFKQSKFASEREITDAYQELRWILSSKIKDKVQDTLSKELWEDAAKLYKDYANLIEYADKEAYAATKWWFKWWAWKFISSAVETVWEPLTQKTWLTIGKIWDAVKKVWNALRPSTWLRWAKTMLEKTWAKPETIDAVINAVSKGEKVAWKVTTKTLWKLLKVAWEIALPLEAIWGLNLIEKNQEVYSLIPYLYEKKKRLEWNPSEEFIWWTEEDWANAWLSENDIWEILQSDEFKEVDSRTSWWWDKLFEEFVWLANYEPIRELWD